jgi:hypothetical protein
MRRILKVLVTAIIAAAELAVYLRFGWTWWTYGANILANLILLLMWASKTEQPSPGRSSGPGETRRRGGFGC